MLKGASGTFWKNAGKRAYVVRNKGENHRSCKTDGLITSVWFLRRQGKWELELVCGSLFWKSLSCTGRKGEVGERCRQVVRFGIKPRDFYSILKLDSKIIC